MCFAGRLFLLTVLYAAFPGTLLAESSANLAGVAYQFDSSLLMGASVDLSRFNASDWFPAGNYRVDLYINQAFAGREDVAFQANESGQPLPCLKRDLLEQAGAVLGEVDEEQSNNCRPIAQWVEGAFHHFDVGQLRLDISIPQASMRRTPRAYVSPSQWDAGESMLFSNYSVNIQESRIENFGPSRYAFVGLNTGFNVGLWRFRHQSSFNASERAGARTQRWDSIRTYVQRALPSLQSEMTLGDSFVSGSLFGSVGYRGLNLQSDTRMLPGYLRFYAPQVRGAATSNARVIVRQNQQVIYETTVSPGPFVIDDLAASSYQGDLEVEVVESNGQSRRFTVPYSAVPESIRPGMGRYSFTLGQLRDGVSNSSNDLFGEMTYQLGLSNEITLNTGVRLARDYVSFLGGGVLATKYGAFGVNLTQATSVDDTGRSEGWRFETNYSKHLDVTNTTFALAGYRYSTEGFVDLAQAFSRRNAQVVQSQALAESLFQQQRNQLVLSVGQPLGKWGQINLTASSSDYYNSPDRDKQLQLSYFNSAGQLGYGFSHTRSQTQDGTPDNLSMLSISLPLDDLPTAPSVSASVSHQQNSGSQLQSSVSGTLGERNNTSYGIDVGRDTHQRTNYAGISAQTRLPVGTLSGSFSQGEGYYQVGMAMRGAAVVHDGGLTLGPYLGETFALVEAKGAEGAEVKNGQGARIDQDGYAVVPSLSPYRYNEVSIDSAKMDQRTDLLVSKHEVAPYAGAAVKLRFDTLRGYGVLVRAKGEKGKTLPLGAIVKDKKGRVVGTVGQASRIFARVDAEEGYLSVELDAEGERLCLLPYSLSADEQQMPLIRLESNCLTQGGRS